MELVVLVDDFEVHEDDSLKLFDPLVGLGLVGSLTDLGQNQFAQDEVCFVHVAGHVQHLDPEELFVLFKALHLSADVVVNFVAVLRLRHWRIVLTHQLEEGHVEEQQLGSVVQYLVVFGFQVVTVVVLRCRYKVFKLLQNLERRVNSFGQELLDVGEALLLVYENLQVHMYLLKVHALGMRVRRLTIINSTLIDHT